MKHNKRVDALVRQAESQGRCCFGSNNAEYKALRRRLCVGELVSPYPNLYARAAYWVTLDPSQQTVQVAKALGMQHKNWVFAGPTAAAIWGLEHEWSIHHKHIHIARKYGQGAGSKTSCKQLKYVRMKEVSACQVSNLRVTNPARTLVDCGRMHTFEEVLPMFDSALRKRLTTAAKVELECCTVHKGRHAILRLLFYANPLSENGGESACRAAIIEAGFQVPQLQCEFRDPLDRGKVVRVDFAWFLVDGRTVVLEFDGTSKYVSPHMVGGRNIRQVVADEREREKLLYRAGVSGIVRINYGQLRLRKPLLAALRQIRIPQRVGP